MDQSNHNKKEKDAQEDVSLGSLLKRSREERHIDLDEAFRVTRIRRHTLEALENEQWDKLPSQVFVKGFLRTYAEFLGLDKEMVLTYYQRISPFEKDKSDILKQVSPQAARWHLKIIIPLLALAFILSVIYLNRKNISIVEKAFQYMGTQGPVKEEEEPVAKEGTKALDERDTEQLSLSNEKKLEKEEKAPSKPKSIEEPLVLEDTGIAKETSEEPLPPRFILTANVKGRTWIAIYVDDEPVKEYLFQPGDTVKWTADKGFDILVGNAGGIEFFLNGNQIGHLGAEGKVVRLKLPEGYE